jgi:hypothetical protein
LKPLDKKEKAVVLIASGLGVILIKVIGGALFTAAVNLRDRILEKKYKNSTPYPLNTLLPFSMRECLRIEVERQKH